MVGRLSKERNKSVVKAIQLQDTGIPIGVGIGNRTKLDIGYHTTILIQEGQSIDLESIERDVENRNKYGNENMIDGSRRRSRRKRECKDFVESEIGVP
jgi:hypothetical protein